MKKIGILVDNFSQGGLQKTGYFLANCFAESKYKVFFYALSYTKPVWFLNEDIKIFGLDYKVTRKTSTKLFQCIKSANKLKKLLKKHNIDCLYVLGDMTLLVAYLSRIKNLKLIGSERNAPIRYNFYWKHIMTYLYSHCYKVVFQTQGAMDFFNKKVKKNGIVIPNPYFEIQGSKNRKNIKNYISTAAARFEYKKGIDILIKAFALICEDFPGIYLKIVGDGDLKESYIKLAQSLKISDKIEFVGIVNNVVNEVIDTKLFILPSRLEGIPNVLMEVMGAGIPVIASDCPPGGARLLTDNGKYGQLFEPENFKDLANKIKFSLENKEKFNSSQEKEYIINSFNRKRIFTMWEQIINK